MIEILKHIYLTEGKVVNNLIEANILTVDYVVESAVKNGNKEIIYYTAKYVKNIGKQNAIKLADALLEENNSIYKIYQLIYDFAKDIKYAPIQKLEDYLIRIINENKNDAGTRSDILEEICKFANNINKANIEKLEDAIIKLGYAEDIYTFAKVVKKASIIKLTDTIIRTGDAVWIYRFASDIKGVNIEKLANAIIKTKSSRYIYYFARDIKNAPIHVLEDGILQTISSDTKDTDKSNNIIRICDFANNIENANIDKIIDGVIKSNDINSIITFAKNAKNVNIEKLEDAVIQMGSALDIYTFARNVKGIRTNLLADTLIEKGNNHVIWLFARDIKSAPVDKLADFIIKTKDPDYIYKFITIEGSPLDKLVDALLETKSIIHINGAQGSLKMTNRETIDVEDIRKMMGQVTYEKKLYSQLVDLANNGDIEKLRINSEIYRTLLGNTEKLTQKESKPKSRTLKR